MADVPDRGIHSLIEWAGGERTSLAITFTDIKDSTRLADELGDEQMREVQKAHFGQSTSFIAANGGHRIKGLGDGDMAAFQNVEAALDYVRALQADPGHGLLDSRLRAGIHIGPVTVTADDVHGNTVNFASRVGSATKAAEIWLSDESLQHLVTLRAARHGELRWQDHPGAPIAGLGAYTLWSLSASGRTLTELAADFRRARIMPQQVAETNIPAGMVPRVFRGRDEALAAIEEALRGGDKPVLVTAPSVTALHGLRGVGKSVLAAAYAELHRARYRATWWIRSETEAGLRADLAGLAVRLGWVAADATEEAALRATGEGLRREGGGILLVFDNARDVETLRTWLPRSGTCDIVVTSNAPNWGAVAIPVQIRVWPKEIGGDFLLARIARPVTERAAAEALSEVLGGLPLAHEMAASYCERIGTSYAEYQRRFREAPARLLDSDKDAPPDYHDRLTVVKTFALAIEEAAKLNSAAVALIILASHVAPEPIPLTIFERGFKEPFTAGGLDEAVAALRAFALVDCESIADERVPAVSINTIRLHRLVREVAFSRTPEDGRQSARLAMIEALAAAYPSNVHSDSRTWPLVRKLDAHALALLANLETLPTAAAEATVGLLNSIASYRFGVLANYNEAKALLEDALRLSESALGPRHSETGNTINSLAAVFLAQGDGAAAGTLYERALAISKKVNGPNHPSTASASNNLGLVLKRQGEFSAARALFERALAIFRKKSVETEVATTLGNIGLLMLAEGKLMSARSRLAISLRIREKTLGPQHFDTAVSLNNLGGAYVEEGDFAKAKPLFERALAILEHDPFRPTHSLS